MTSSFITPTYAKASVDKTKKMKRASKKGYIYSDR